MMLSQSLFVASVRFVPRSLIYFLLVSFPLTSCFAEEQKRFNAEAFCHLDDKTLTVQTIVSAHFTYKEETSKLLGYSTADERILFNFDCDLKSSSCNGFRINLKDIDAGNRLRLLDANIMSGMKVVAKTGDIITLQWGDYRTIIVDLSMPRVQYLESGPTTTGRGEGPCK